MLVLYLSASTGLLVLTCPFYGTQLQSLWCSHHYFSHSRGWRLPCRDQPRSNAMMAKTNDREIRDAAMTWLGRLRVRILQPAKFFFSKSLLKCIHVSSLIVKYYICEPQNRFERELIRLCPTFLIHSEVHCSIVQYTDFVSRVFLNLVLLLKK